MLQRKPCRTAGATRSSMSRIVVQLEPEKIHLIWRKYPIRYLLAKKTIKSSEIHRKERWKITIESAHLNSMMSLDELFMTRQDFQILSTALGFLAIVLKGENARKDGAKQAKAMAVLIESFCRTSHPGLFKDEAEDSELDQIIEDLKDDEPQLGQSTALLANKELLHRVYDRLLQRHKDYATDEMIAGEVAHFLEEEINHNTETKHDDRQRSGG